MAELKQLTQKRTTVKGQLTRMNNNLDAEITAEEARIRATKLDELWEKFEEIQAAIDQHKLANVAPADKHSLLGIQQESDAERQVFEGIFFAAAAKAQRRIEPTQQQRNGNNQRTPAEENGDRKLDIKLPTLKIPEFQGEYNEWLLFKDTYKSMIHDNTSLTPIQKFQYLRNALRGEALQVIGGLEISAASYDDAWDLLTKNYENTKLLINTHLNQLLDFPVVARDKPATIKQLIVHIRTHLKALKTLKLPVDKWDEILIHLVKNKMDYNTQKDWEEETNRDKTKRPTLDEFMTFLSERCRTMEMIDKGRNKQESTKPPVAKKQEKKVSLASVSDESCIICSESHAAYRCPTFLRLSVSDRIKEAKSKKICINCLGKGHFAKVCKSSACKKCQKKHNTLLHLEQEEMSDKKSNEDGPSKIVVTYCEKQDSARSLEPISNINFVRKPTSHIILSTAQVQIEDAEGNQQSTRVLLDPGSQSNLITEALVRKLKLKGERRSELISGINKLQTNIYQTVEVKIKSMHADYGAQIKCLVLPNITERLPQIRINTNMLYLLEGLHLADPNFHEPGTIDLLVGAGLFWQLICADSITQKKGLPRLQNTLLGWIVGGELLDANPKTTAQFCGLVTNTSLQAQMERFWNQEETQETRRFTREEAECERQFVESVKRDKEGRFIVALPKKSEIKLGDSVNQAMRRLYSLERRFRMNPDIKKEYVKFMDDYEKQGHGSLVPDGSPIKPEDIFVLLHQPVIRPDSITTKLRVVFDASAKTSLGTTLNDKLMVGPNLQKDLFEIILRFRSHEFVITADIAAMFRQIEVREEDRDLQRILWRADQTQPTRMYRLNTVTYGTAPAPYLAIRCLRQLAAEETTFPQAAKVLQEDFYMDDVLTGANTVEKTIALRQQLSQLLERGKFQLRKWRSNDQRILNNLSDESEGDSLLKIDKEGALKTLGLLWDARSDTMQYQVTIEESSKITKRDVLSKIAQIFDPLGLLGPVIINAKCIMQQMWQVKTGWDEPLPQELETTWKQYYCSLSEINDVRITRNINQENKNEKLDLVGFGDASETAYGACLYAVSQNSKGETKSQLIASKSRVAPLKTVSLPRLELNAAYLLAKLSDKARNAFSEKIRTVNLFSDLTIVLSWIATSPNIRKTYVANRVSKIQDLSQNAIWRHVRSKENPADLISRGITVENWIQNELWWHGPKWLATGNWPEPSNIEIDTSEMRASAVLVSTSTKYEILERYSSYGKLQRIIAYCLRFKNNALGGKKNGPLSVEELNQAETSIAKKTQREVFSSEFRALGSKQSVPKGSKLAALSPFLDKDGLIRVGGRLSRANIPEAQKHPIVLPARNHVTKLIMSKEHVQLHHCGPEQLLCSLRQRYWPLSGRREARKVTGNCLQCFRSRPKTPEVIMGDLPSERVRESLRPFTTTGVDYAGPLQVRDSRRRGRIHTSKEWIAVFTCFATKAIHLELVTELTTECFLAALRRFVARRGICS